MFRIAIIATITFRVIFCPLFCGGCAGDAQSVNMGDSIELVCVDKPCRCCGCEDRAIPVTANCLDGSRVPCDSECPTDSGCFSHAAPELSGRIVIESVGLAFDARMALADEFDFIKVDSVAEVGTTKHFGLESGRKIRLAFASLLI